MENVVACVAFPRKHQFNKTIVSMLLQLVLFFEFINIQLSQALCPSFLRKIVFVQSSSKHKGDLTIFIMVIPHKLMLRIDWSSIRGHNNFIYDQAVEFQNTG